MDCLSSVSDHRTFLSKYHQVPNIHCTALISITKVTKEEDEALGTKIKGHKTYPNNLKKKHENDKHKFSIVIIYWRGDNKGHTEHFKGSYNDNFLSF